MLESIHIQGFKGFTDTTIGPLRKVNLIVGGQNVGKTSLLEAVYAVTHFLSRRHDFAMLASAFRVVEGGDVERYVDRSLRGDFQFIEARFAEGLLRLQATAKQGMDSERYVSRVENGGWWAFGATEGFVYPANLAVAISLHLPAQTEQVNLFGKIVFANKKQELLSLLQQIELRLKDLNAGSPDGEQRIYAAIEGIANALPTPQLGHGFARLLYLFCHMLATDSKLALIDEVENGIHYSALPTLLQGIKNVARERDVQTLMTTHSWDCIRAACEVFADSPEDFQVIRLERTKDNIRAVCIDGERMQRLMADDREVR